jgi:hypothetical protein
MIIEKLNNNPWRFAVGDYQGIEWTVPHLMISSSVIVL